MELQTGRIFESQISQAEGYWIHVAVTQDERFPEQFQCEVALFLRAPDSDWSPLETGGPVEAPQILRELKTPGDAYAYGLALGHILIGIL